MGKPLNLKFSMPEDCEIDDVSDAFVSSAADLGDPMGADGSGSGFVSLANGPMSSCCGVEAKMSCFIACMTSEEVRICSVISFPDS